MPGYRVYILTESNMIVGASKVISCDNDADAIGQARKMLDSHALELWAGSRKVARFDPENRNETESRDS